MQGKNDKHLHLKTVKPISVTYKNMPVFHMLMEPVTQKGRDFSWGSIRYSTSDEAKIIETCVPAFTIIIIIIICQRDLRC